MSDQETAEDTKGGLIRWWLHHLVAHPLLVLWPRLGGWLHDSTAPPEAPPREMTERREIVETLVDPDGYTCEVVGNEQVFGFREGDEVRRWQTPWERVDTEATSG